MCVPLMTAVKSSSTVTSSICVSIPFQSRYVHLNFHRVKPGNVLHLYDTDNESPSPLRLQSSIKVKRTGGRVRIALNFERERVV